MILTGDIVKAARANAQSAGVDHMIHFQQRPVSALSHPKKYGFIISNPPYGERIEEKKEPSGSVYRNRGAFCDVRCLVHVSDHFLWGCGKIYWS